MKICSRCHQEKSFTEFHKYSTQKDGYHYYCKDCRKIIEKTPTRLEYAKKYVQMRLNADSQYQQHSRRQKRYGIKPEEYIALWEKQDGKCAICKQEETALYKGRQRSLAVDHCHTTGFIRGLLCNACNNGLGRFRDDIKRLQLAIEYLHGS
jgi:hypothetical protein